MNRKRVIGKIILFAAMIAISFTPLTSADSATVVQPGSVDDPVVTKSYVDQQLKQQIASQIAAQTSAQLSAQIASEVAAQLAKQTPSGNTSSKLTVVQLAAGQTLIAGAGSEIIVRTGSVIAVGSDGNGIPNVTGGKDIAIGAPITNNHLLVFPTDKRGIKPDPKQSAPIFVMVRGGFTLFNADGSIVSP